MDQKEAPGSRGAGARVSLGMGCESPAPGSRGAGARGSLGMGCESPDKTNNRMDALKLVAQPSIGNLQEDKPHQNTHDKPHRTLEDKSHQNTHDKPHRTLPKINL